MSSKRPLDDLLELGEEEKITQSQVVLVGRLLQHGDVLLSQELSDAQGTVSSCPATTLPCSRTLSEATHSISL